MFLSDDPNETVNGDDISIDVLKISAHRRQSTDNENTTTRPLAPDVNFLVYKKKEKINDGRKINDVDLESKNEEDGKKGVT